MKELILKANAFLTAILLMVVPLCLACAIEGNSPLQDWIRYACIALLVEAVVWVCIGIGCIVHHFLSLPPMRRGYITYDEKYGWMDEGGRRP